MSGTEARYMAAVGMFDGLHSGHLFVLGQLRRLAAERGLQPMVITFRRHPADTLAPSKAPKLIMGPEAKAEAIRSLAAIDTVEVTDFTPRFASMTAAAFLTLLKERGVAALAMGFNNHIGSDRLDADAARALGIIDIAALPPCPGDESTSSSALRQAIAEADFDTAARLLGRPFTIEGTVVGGKQLGRTIGFPTANISPEIADRQLLPPDGAYAADIAIDGDSTTHRAMVNIGLRPTVDHTAPPARTIEAHILDFDADIYGRHTILTFRRRLRPERRFNSLDALRAQLALDAAAARNS